MTKLRLVLALAGIIGGSVAAGGCLQKEVTATFYLEPDASLTWQTHEIDVRSDSESADDRQKEEQTYLTGVRNLDHPMAIDFRRLGGSGIQTHILRSVVPYTVVTEARFPNIADLGTQILTDEKIAGTSVLTPNGTGFTWTLTNSHTSDNGDVSALLSFVRLRVVMNRGRFTAAQGFDLSSDKRVASIIVSDDSDGDQKLPGQNRSWTWSLSWTGQ